MLEGMKTLIFLFALSAQASELPLQDMEAHCWSEAQEKGSLLCQNLLISGKVNGQYVYPELAADADEKKTWNQAILACQALGFRYSTGFELDRTKKETLFLRLEESGPAMTWRGEGPYIRHLLCQ
jgi:hypothetical protein